MFTKFGETYSNIQVFNVKVKNDDEAIELIEGFDEKMEARIGMIWQIQIGRRTMLTIP